MRNSGFKTMRHDTTMAELTSIDVHLTMAAYSYVASADKTDWLTMMMRRREMRHTL